MFCRAEEWCVFRQFVGYDRYEGEAAYCQLVELYRALRLYVNFFQPSLKLKEKHRQGTTVRRTYAPAQTPFERLCAASILTTELETRLEAPVRFAINACGVTNQPEPADAPAAPIVRQKRAYHRKHPQIPRWWRSR